MTTSKSMTTVTPMIRRPERQASAPRQAGRPDSVVRDVMAVISMLFGFVLIAWLAYRWDRFA